MIDFKSDRWSSIIDWYNDMVEYIQRENNEQFYIREELEQYICDSTYLNDEEKEYLQEHYTCDFS